jgi:predicted dehydrogenase
MVGSGFMSRKHCSVLKEHPSADLNTLVDIEINEHLKSFKNEFGFNKITTNLEEAVKDCDIIFIVTPNLLHYGQTITALEQHKHVFCEKPLSYLKTEYDKIKIALDQSGCKLQVGMNCRFRKINIETKRLIDEKVIGNIMLISGSYVFDLVDSIKSRAKKWWLEYPAGTYTFLHAGAIHTLDLMRWYGGEVKSVTAEGNAFELKEEWEKDTFVANLEYKNGITGRFICSASAYKPSDFSVEVLGTKGSICGNDIFLKEDMNLNKNEIDIKQEKPDLILQFEDLIDSIENNREPLNSFNEALQNFELISAIEKSVKTSRKIYL